MFTSIDKALVAVVTGIVYIASQFIELPFTEAQVGVVLAAVTPLLVYFVPNKG